MTDELKQLAAEGMPLVLEDLDTGTVELVQPEAVINPIEAQEGQLELFTAEEYEVPKHYTQPTSWALSRVEKTISLGDKLTDPAALKVMQRRLAEISHSTGVAGKKLQKESTSIDTLIFSKGGKELKVKFTNLKAVCGKNTGTMRIFKVIMGELARQVYYNKNIVYDRITIPEKLLVDLHIYSNQDSAYKGWKKAVSTLKGFTISATLNGKKPDFMDYMLFTSMGKVNGSFVVDLNTKVWPLLITGLAYTPTWVLDQKLNINTLLLADFIYEMIRIKKAELKVFNNGMDNEAAYFDLKLVNLQEVMNLPSCEAAKSNAAQYIKKPIETAVKEFNTTAAENDDSQVKLVIIPSAGAVAKCTTQQWLDTYGLRVYVQGRLLDEMQKLEQRQGEIIKAIMEKRLKRLADPSK